MTGSDDRRAIVEQFARGLDTEAYALARPCLDAACRYEIGEETLVGPDAILASYRANGDWAALHFESIAYESAVAFEASGEAVITFVDLLRHAGREHVHRCTQRLAFDATGRIVRIVHCDLPGEREALRAFLEAVGIDRAAPAFTLRPIADGEAAACEAVMRGLPEWFGIESAILDYRRDVASMETIVADVAGAVVGFVTLMPSTEQAIEIRVMAVAAGRQGRGIGRGLVAAGEARARERGATLFHVKTLGPSRPCAAYARTRGFYRAMGFLPLEENRLWGETNPCLMLVKPLPPRE